MGLRLIARLLTIEAVRALARNKIRTTLAVIGIMAGVSTVIWVVAIGRAGTEQAEADLDNLGDNLVWIEAGSRSANGVRTGTHGMTTLTASDARAIRDEVPAITRVSENVDGALQVVYGGRNWNTRFRGVSPEYRDIKRWELAAGEFFTADQTEHAQNVVVIGETVRVELFGDDSPIGELVRIRDAWFEVVGVLAPKGASATGQDQDDTLMMPWTTAQKRIQGKDVTWMDDILCSASSTDSINTAIDEVSTLLRERHHIELGGEDDFNIRHAEELLQAKLRASRTLQRLLLSLASIALLVGGIGIMNVMLASVAQRTAEIGVRVAIGATPGAIQIQFLGEAVMLTLVGGTLGVLLGAAGGSIIERTLGWRLTSSIETDLLAVGFSVAVGVFFGFYPATRASRLDPIEALRNE